MKLPHFLSKLIPGYKVIDLKEWRKHSKIEIYLKKDEEVAQECFCSRCGEKLQQSHGKYRLKLKHLPIFEQDCFIMLWREKRYCPHCKKVRSEALDFISKDSPLLTQEYAWWLGRMFEIASVKQVAKISRNEINNAQTRL